MLARTCLLSGEKTNSMSSVIRLLDQTYQRLLCDENNIDKNSNATKHNDQQQNLKEQNHENADKNDEEITKMEIDASSPQTKTTPLNANVISMNGRAPSTSTSTTTSSSLQNELSSTSSSALSASSQISNEIKHVSNKKVALILLFYMFL